MTFVVVSMWAAGMGLQLAADGWHFSLIPGRTLAANFISKNQTSLSATEKLEDDAD